MYLCVCMRTSLPALLWAEDMMYLPTPPSWSIHNDDGGIIDDSCWGGDNGVMIRMLMEEEEDEE